MTVAQAASPPPSALTIQARVIGALFMRELKTRFDGPFGVLSIIVEPLALAALITGSRYIRRTGGAEFGLHEPFMFFVISYAGFFLFRRIIAGAVGSVESNNTLMFHRNITVLDLVFSRNLLEFAVVTTILTLIVIVAGFAIDSWPVGIPVMLGAAVLMFLLSQGFALCLGCIAAMSPGIGRLLGRLTFLALPFSAVFHSIDSMNLFLRSITVWVPMAHLSEMLREGYFGDAVTSYYDVGYVLAWIIGSTFIGLVAVRAVRRRLEF